MTKNPTFVREQTKVGDAIDLLHTMEIRHLPVVNDEREVVGMLSDRDLRAVRPDGMAVKVSSLMSGDVLAVEEEDDVKEVVELMLENKIGAVPVVDGEGVLVGIISYVDVLRCARFD